MKTEIWQPVKGYENYEVSNLGRVKSLGNEKSRKEKILKPIKDKYGYLNVNLCRNGKHKMFRIHRLVATAFLPNPEGLEQINHKDEVKTNNCVNNLEFCDAKYNINYGHHNEKVSVSLTNHPTKSRAVEASKYEDFREICLKFPSANEAGRNGYSSGNVSACCNGCYSTYRRNFYKQLYWRFAS